jgi:hypothetical protein
MQKGLVEWLKVLVQSSGPSTTVKKKDITLLPLCLRRDKEVDG